MEKSSEHRTITLSLQVIRRYETYEISKLLYEHYLICPLAIRLGNRTYRIPEKGFIDYLDNTGYYFLTNQTCPNISGFCRILLVVIKI